MRILLMVLVSPGVEAIERQLLPPAAPGHQSQACGHMALASGLSLLLQCSVVLSNGHSAPSSCVTHVFDTSLSTEACGYLRPQFCVVRSVFLAKM